VFLQEVAMSPYRVSSVVLFIVSALLAGWIIRWLRSPLQSLLGDVIGTNAVAEYYLRVFVLVIVFMVLAAVADPTFNFKDTVRPVEYVWAVTHGLKSVFENLMVAIFVYLGLITILVAALRRRS
jgi:Na+-driven multidrug efflux pump